MRSQDEIVKKIKEVSGDDFFGFIKSDLLGFLDYSHAKPYLKDGVTEDEWNDVREELSRENVIIKMKDYLDFAFEKAEDERGLSVARSMDHYYAWIWLIGEEEYFGDIRNYSAYGLPHLYKIKEWLDKLDNAEK